MILIHLNPEAKVYDKNKQREILSWNRQWKKENALGLPNSGSGRATNGLVGSLEGMFTTNQK